MKISSLHDQLVGTWTGTMTLYTNWLPVLENPSASRLVVAPVAGTHFLSFSYTWSYEGKPNDGILLAGNSNEKEAVSAAWIDSWHQNGKVLHLSGDLGDDGVIKMLGSFAAPPGPDWGWRIEVSVRDGAPRIAMFVISPDGKEDPAVDSIYLRA